MTTPEHHDIFEAATANDLQAVKYFVEKKEVPVRAMNDNDQTAAHIAAKNRNLDIVTYLVSKDTTILKVRDKWGQTILHQAVKAGCLDMVKYLVDDCDAKILATKSGIFGDTSVHVAAQEGQVEILKYFLEDRQHDPNMRNTLGEPPMFLAAEKMQKHVVAYLCEVHNADPTQLDKNQSNILFASAKKGDLKVPKYLMDERKVPLDVNWQDVFGNTIIYVACRYNQLKFIKFFVEQKNADVNIANKNGSTPMHEAAAEGYLDIVRYLHEKGANVDCKDNSGKTPKDVAKNKEIVDFYNSLTGAGSTESMTTSSTESTTALSVSTTVAARKRRNVDQVHQITHSWMGSAMEGTRARIASCEDKSFGGIAFGKAENLLVLVNAWVRHYKGSRYKRDEPESLLSPHAVIMSKIDPLAIEAININ